MGLIGLAFLVVRIDNFTWAMATFPSSDNTSSQYMLPLETCNVTFWEDYDSHLTEDASMSVGPKKIKAKICLKDKKAVLYLDITTMCLLLG